MRTLEDFGLSPQPVKMLAVLVMAFILIGGLLCLVFYVMKALGIYDMSKKCGIRNRWYAFVPLLNAYTLGRLAEKYQNKNGKSAKYLKVILPVLYAVVAVLLIISTVMGVLGGISLLFDADKALADEKQLEEEAFTQLFSAFVPLLMSVFFIIVKRIVTFIALFKIYSAFDYKNAVVLLIFSILFNSVLVPVFLFSIRKKEPCLSYDERAGEEFSNFNFGG